MRTTATLYISAERSDDLVVRVMITVSAFTIDSSRPPRACDSDLDRGTSKNTRATLVALRWISILVQWDFRCTAEVTSCRL